MRKKFDYVIFLHNGLGDLIMALPCLEVLKKNSSAGSKILVYVKCEASKGILGLAELDDRFEVRVLNRKFAVLTCVLMRLNPPRVLLAPQGAGDWKMPLMALLTGAKQRVGIEGMMSKWAFDVCLPHSRKMQMHRTPHHLELMSLAGLDVSQVGEPHLSIPDELVAAARQKLRPEVNSCSQIYVFSPGGKEQEWRKRWPVGSYAALATLLLSRDAQSAIVVSGSPAERQLLEEIVELVPQHLQGRIQVWNEPDMSLSLALFKLSHLAVTNCNGTSHLATAVGTLVVGLYGPTDPGNTGPYSSKIHVLRLGFSCSPCYDESFTFYGCDDRPCLTLMSPEKVYRAIRDVESGAAIMGGSWHGSSGLRRPPNVEVDRFKLQMEQEIAID